MLSSIEVVAEADMTGETRESAHWRPEEGFFEGVVSVDVCLWNVEGCMWKQKLKRKRWALAKLWCRTSPSHVCLAYSTLQMRTEPFSSRWPLQATRLARDEGGR